MAGSDADTSARSNADFARADCPASAERVTGLAEAVDPVAGGLAQLGRPQEAHAGGGRIAPGEGAASGLGEQVGGKGIGPLHRTRQVPRTTLEVGIPAQRVGDGPMHRAHL